MIDCKVLLAIQKGIKDPVKDSTNPHFKNTYASLEAVLHAVKPVLQANGVAMFQNLITGEAGAMSLELLLVHESGEMTFGPMPVPSASSTDPQKVKGGVTYMRRTQLLSVFGLADVDDDGNEAAGTTEKKAPKKSKGSPPPEYDLGKIKDRINAFTTLAGLKDYWKDIVDGTVPPGDDYEELKKVAAAAKKKIQEAIEEDSK